MDLNQSTQWDSSTKSVLFTNASVLTPDRAYSKGFIAMSHEKIFKIGSMDCLDESEFFDFLRVDAQDFLITPGLVNGHTHVAMSPFHSLSHQVDLVEIMQLEQAFSKSFIQTLCLPSIYSSLRSGVTCFVDHYYFASEVAGALDSVGVKGLVGETVSDSGCAFSDQSFQRACDLLKNWKFSSRIKPVLCPHATNTVSDKLFQDINDLSRSENLPLHYHLSQTLSEQSFSKKNHGMTPFARVKKLNVLHEQSFVVHCLYMEDEDYRILADSGATVGVCPTSQIAFEHFVDLSKLIQHQIPFAVGTDAVGFNDHMDLMEEFRFLYYFLKRENLSYNLLENMFKVLHSQVLSCLNSESCFSGNLSPNSPADLVFLKKDGTVLPIHDLKTAFALSFSSRQVEHVMVDGRWVLWKQKPTLIDWDQVQKDYLVICKKLFKL